jgi:hypothetical protein
VRHLATPAFPGTGTLVIAGMEAFLEVLPAPEAPIDMPSGLHHLAGVELHLSLAAAPGDGSAAS